MSWYLAVTKTIKKTGKKSILACASRSQVGAVTLEYAATIAITAIIMFTIVYQLVDVFVFTIAADFFSIFLSPGP